MDSGFDFLFVVELDGVMRLETVRRTVGASVAAVLESTGADISTIESTFESWTALRDAREAIIHRTDRELRKLSPVEL